MSQEIRTFIDEKMENAIVVLNAITPLEVTSKEDSLLNDIADFYKKRGALTVKQIQLIKPILKRRSTQIAATGIKFELSKTAPAKEKNFNLVKMVKKQKDIRSKMEKSRPSAPSTYKNATQLDQFTIELRFTYDQELIAKIKDIAGRKFVSDNKSWTIPLTIINIEKIEVLGFTLSIELIDWKRKIRVETAIADTINIPKLDNVLRPFQKTGVAFIEAKQGRALIADDMGLGKTLQSIAWIELNKDKNIYPIVIVCPAAVKLNWKREFKKFTGIEDIEILAGRTPYTPQEQILIINYDILEAWEQKLLALKPVTIIADEIHKCKGDSKRQKSLTRISKKVKHFIGLTGTPILNRPIEILHPVRMIQPNLFPSVKAFKYRYCGPKFNGFAMEFKGATNTVELNQLLTSNLMVRRKKEDVLTELPDKTMSVVPIEITNKADYDFAVSDLIAFLKEIDEEKAIKAARAKAIVKLNTLKQLAVEGKLAQSVTWIRDFLENDNEKLIVFVHHKKTVELLMKEFSNIAVKYVGGMSDAQRKEAERAFWEDEKIRLFIGNIEAAGTGINLQIASNVAFLEYPWSPGLYGQATDRAHRMGQKNAVNVWNFVATDTIEEQIITVIEEKSKVIAQIIDGDASDGNGMFNEMIKGFYKKGRFA